MAKITYNKKEEETPYATYGDVLVVKDDFGSRSFFMVTPSERGGNYPYVLFDLNKNEKYNAFQESDIFHIDGELNSIMKGHFTVVDVISAKDVKITLEY